MEKEASEGSHTRGILESRLEIGPMKEQFDELTCRTEGEMSTIAGTQNVITLFLPWRNDLNISTFLRKAAQSASQ